MEWKLIGRPGATALEQFLSAEEPAAVVVSERVRGGNLDRRLRNGGRCFHLHGVAAVYQGPGGFLAPIGLERLAQLGNAATLLHQLRRGLGTFVRCHSIMGRTRDVEILQDLVGGRPRHVIDYQLLSLRWAGYPPPGPPPTPGMTLTRPRPSAWKELMPLQMAYEVEEVLLPGREPQAAQSRAALAASLEHQRVLIARLNGQIIARVATNARGFQGDQIGGVYTDPGWRQRGVSRWLMTHLLADLRRDERHASLFVKDDNRPARELYRSLGFSFVSPFRISYYQ